ncbi:hypothetical protein ACIOYT_32430 [Streptomyces halstedii]|uniref:hypothetical protein n=1 Tax=Streptomyces halstedii TaxID=1944 RepID=UPI00380773AF
MRVADPGGEDRHGASNLAHRLAQPGRDLPGLLCGERRPHGFDDIVLALVAGAHDSNVLWAGGRGQGVLKYGRELRLTTS